MITEKAIDTLRLMQKVRIGNETKAIEAAINALKFREPRMCLGNKCPRCGEQAWYGYTFNYYCCHCGQAIEPEE